MKKILILATSILLSGVMLASCGKNNNNNQDSPTVTPIKHHLIGFYVDDVLYSTIQVEENKTINEKDIASPKKDGFTFVGWKNSIGDLFDFNQTITSSFNLYAYFELNGKGNPHEGENDLSVTDTKDPTKTYSLVIGWYGKSATSGIDKTLMQHIYNNFIKYFRAQNVEEEVINNITVRQYGDENTKVGPMGELINNDGDVDILLGVGVNITTTGKVTTVSRTDGVTFGEKASRSIALVKETTLGRNLFDYISSADGQQFFNYDYHFAGDIKSSFIVNFYVNETLYISTSVNRGELINIASIKEPTDGDKVFRYWGDKDGREFDFTTKVNDDISLYAVFKDPALEDPHKGESELNVKDTKDASKTYSLVIGWYGLTSTSGIDEATMQHIYKNIRTYLIGENVSNDVLDKISVREYTSAKIADVGTLVNTDGDVDIFMGAGGNMTSKGNIQTVTPEDLKTDFTITGKEVTKTGRAIGLLKESTLARQVFTFITSEEGKQILDYNYHYTK